MFGNVNGASFLWISTRRRAIAALLAGFLVFTPIIVIESWGPWKLLGDMSLKKNAPQALSAVTSLAWAAKRNVDVVLLIGGSTSREFTASDAHISRLLTQKCGHPMRFINAGTSSQNLLESWQITDAIPSSQRRLVVVGFNYLRFESGRRQVYESTRTSTLPFQIPEHLKQSLSEFHFSSIATIFNPKAIAWLLKSLIYIDIAAAPLSHQSLIASSEEEPYISGRNLYRDPALSQSRKEEFVSHMIMERLPIYQAMHNEALDLWKIFTHDFVSSNSKVLFLGLPVSQEMKPLNDITVVPMTHDLSRLQSAGALVVDWRTDHGLSEGDFYDQQHLLSSGRGKLEKRFIDLLITSTPGCSR